MSHLPNYDYDAGFINNKTVVTGSTGKFDKRTLPSQIDVAVLANGLVTNTNFQYLQGVTSNIQTQFNSLNSTNIWFKVKTLATTNIDLSVLTADTPSFDGLTMAAGDLFLVMPVASGGFQTDAKEGGIWVYTGAGLTATRYNKMATTATLCNSKIVVEYNENAAYSGKEFKNTNRLNEGTLGSFDVKFTDNAATLAAGQNIRIVNGVINTADYVTLDTLSLTNRLLIKTSDGFYSASFNADGLTKNVTVKIPDASNATAIIPLSAPTATNALNDAADADKVVHYIDETGNQILKQLSTSNLEDVVFTSIEDKDVLQYNATLSKFENKKIVIDPLNEVLSTLVTTAYGNILTTSTIKQAFDFLAADHNRKSAGVKTANYQLQITERGCTIGAAGVTITAPAVAAFNGVEGVRFTIVAGQYGATFAVQSGDSYNGVVDGTENILPSEVFVFSIMDGQIIPC